MAATTLTVPQLGLGFLPHSTVHCFYKLNQVIQNYCTMRTYLNLVSLLHLCHSRWPQLSLGYVPNSILCIL